MIIEFFSFLKPNIVSSMEIWLQKHNYSAGEHCQSLDKEFKIDLDSKGGNLTSLDLNITRDKRALAGKWIVIILAILHLLKEFFQFVNVSTM